MAYGYDDYQPRRPQSQSASPVLLLLAFVAVLIAAGALLWQYWPFGSKEQAHQKDYQMRPVSDRGPLWPEEEGVIQLFENARKSVVYIYTENALGRPAGSGTGFIWDEKGWIVTNYHVIEGASVINVILADQSKHKALKVGWYADKDIAVIKLTNPPKNKLRPLPLGESGNLKVGQYAFAIGSPFGLDQTLTRGIISALGREIQTVRNRPSIKNVIQTDAAINPGNSGGPLLDTAGRLIGMNTAIASPSGTSAGIGFAIPVDEINPVVTEIIQSGTVTRPVIGVLIHYDQFAEQFNLQGALIKEVMPGSPAEQAGLRGTEPGRLGDVIVQVDQTPIKKVKDLIDALQKHKVGDEVKLTYLREEKKKEVTVTLVAAE